MIFFYQKTVILLLHYKYFILFPLVMVEGPITTMVAGFLSSLGYMDFVTAYFLAVVADLTSDAGYYFLGRLGRKSLIEKYGHYVGITRARIEKFENQVKKHGVKMIIFGKIADPLSATIQTIAGFIKMDFKKYAAWNAAITFSKSLVLITIGFYFGEAISQADFYRQAAGLIVSFLGVVILLAYYLYRKIIEKKIEKNESVKS